MALREIPSAFRRLAVRELRPFTASIPQNARHYASTTAQKTESKKARREELKKAPRTESTKALETEATKAFESQYSKDLEDLEEDPSFMAKVPYEDERIRSWDPVERSRSRRLQLPPSRYQYRSPRYYRGPLHPHQPPPKSDPASREFVPGPFSYTRLEQTYQSTIAPDLMTLAYAHKIPGEVEAPKAERLRTWDDSSPYHKGRPKRGPRGAEVLGLIERDFGWQKIPRIEEVTVHSMVKGAIDDIAYLHVAGMLLQSITGAKPEFHKAKKSIAAFGIRDRMSLAVTCTMRGGQAYDFVDKMVNLVFPRLKEWPGIKGTTGDSNGNLSWGFSREGAILFPEVEINYDMYPPKMIPGFHVTVKTSATSDRHARLLLKSLGVPFYGKLVN